MLMTSSFLPPTPTTQPASQASCPCTSSWGLKLVIKRGHLHVVKSNIVKERLARYGGELGWETDEVRLPLHKIWIFIVLIQPLDQGHVLGSGELHLSHLVCNHLRLKDRVGMGNKLSSFYGLFQLIQLLQHDLV